MKMSGVEEEWGGDKRFQRNRTKMVFYSVARQSVVSQEGKIKHILLFFFMFFADRLRFVLRLIITICSLDRESTLGAKRVNER